jgi:hypothetical protein
MNTTTNTTLGKTSAFCKLAIGETFIVRYKNTKHMASIYGEYQETEYRKASKTAATAISQKGYGNTDSVGHSFSFAPFATVTRNA